MLIEKEKVRMNDKNLNKISDVSETLLIPLYSRAIESQSCDPIIVDGSLGKCNDI